MKVITRVFLFITFTLNIFAQTGTLKGKVVDKEDGEILIGANVILLGTKFGAASDIDGNYEIKNIPVGNYSVKVSFVGYKTIEMESIRLIASDCILDFELGIDKDSDVLIVREKPTFKSVRSCEPQYDFLKPRGLFIDTLIHSFKNRMPLDSVKVN